MLYVVSVSGCSTTLVVIRCYMGLLGTALGRSKVGLGNEGAGRCLLPGCVSLQFCVPVWVLYVCVVVSVYACVLYDNALLRISTCVYECACMYVFLGICLRGHSRVM